MNIVLTDNRFEVLGDLHGFCKWKSPLIDALARAIGCKLQVLKVRTGEKNVILFGQAANATKAIKRFHTIERDAQQACCDQMEPEGVPKTENAYAASFYVGFIEGIREQLRDEIATHVKEVDEAARQFPETSALYPVRKKIDARIAELGRDAGRRYKIR